MLELLKEIKDDVRRLAGFISKSKNIELRDKLKSKRLEEELVDKLNNVLSVNPITPEKRALDFLSVGDVDKICAMAVSDFNNITTQLSSLIFSKDKTVVSFTTNDGIVGKEVRNTFTNVNGVVEYVFNTKTESYCIVYCGDGQYYVGTRKYWREKIK
jgi:hypothetical protein